MSLFTPSVSLLLISIYQVMGRSDKSSQQRVEQIKRANLLSDRTVYVIRPNYKCKGCENVAISYDDEALQFGFAADSLKTHNSNFVLI